MFDLSHLPLFVLASVAVLLMPGPNVLYVMARSMNQGRKAGMVAVLGLETGTLLQVTGAALGISAVALSCAPAFDAIKYVGAAYLLYLGTRKALERRAPAESNAAALASLHRVFGQAVLVGVLNPKTALFFLAFLPQFVEPARGSLAMQTELLGLIFIALATTTDGGYALLAASLRQRLRRSKHFATGQRYFTATMFIALSVGAALTERAREEES
jgi:threonine/homoserine/homoserine lactone efflux protein